MSDFPGLFESISTDDSQQRLASRKALVVARERLDQRLGAFLGASTSQEEFEARYDLVSDDFKGIVNVTAAQYGADGPVLVETLKQHFADKWIQKVVDKKDFDKGGLHRATDTPEDEKIPESKIENLEEHGTKNEKEKAQFAENVKKGKKDEKAEDDDDDGDDGGGDTLDFVASAADAAPFVGRPRWSPVRTAADGDSYDQKTEKLPTGPADSTTGLDGPSPKIDKGPSRKPGDQGWSLDDIDVPSKAHPTETIDVTEALPRENVTDSVKDNVEGIGEQTTEQVDLPSGTGMDDAGFNAEKNTGTSGPTKTFGDGKHADPVGSASLEG
jgi:hypothetical protein